MKRPCLTCGTPTEHTRCALHERTYDQTRRPGSVQRGYGADYQRQRAPLIGQPCALRLPGCTGVADTADHVVPVSLGGSGSALRPACKHCNSARGNRGGRPGDGNGRVASNPVLGHSHCVRVSDVGDLA